MHPDGLRAVIDSPSTSSLRGHFDKNRYSPSAICAIAQTHLEPRGTTAQLLLTEDTFTNHEHIFVDRVHVNAMPNKNLTYATKSWASPGLPVAK